MKCKEVLELISSAVDNQLNEKEKLILNEHLKVCPKCKREYELERITKGFISSVCHSVDTPEALKEKIVYQINNCKSQARVNLPFLNLKNKYWYWIVPISIIIVIFIFTSRSSHNHPVNLSENNLIRITYSHFDKILDGAQEISVRTKDPSVLKNKLTLDGESEINIIELYNCELIGGWRSKEFGKNIIHTLYKNEEEFIYCSQINFNELLKDSQLYLDRNIIEKLKENGRYVHKDFGCCSIIFWLHENQLCIITAEMDTNKLLSHLQE